MLEGTAIAAIIVELPRFLALDGFAPRSPTRHAYITAYWSWPSEELRGTAAGSSLVMRSLRNISPSL